MDLRHLGAVGERLAVAGNAGLVGLDHHGIGEDHRHHLFVVTDGDRLPAFVSSELREREPIRHRTVYLAWPVSCAEVALLPRTASTETASETTTITTAGILLLFIATPLVV